MIELIFKLILGFIAVFYGMTILIMLIDWWIGGMAAPQINPIVRRAKCPKARASHDIQDVRPVMGRRSSLLKLRGRGRRVPSP